METLASSRTALSSRTAVLAVLLAVGAVTAAANLLLRPIPALDFGTYAAVRAERDAVWLFSLLGGVSTAVVQLTAGLVACVLIRHKGAALATIGAVLTGLAGVLFCAGFFAIGAVDWYLTADASGGQALFAYFQSASGQVFGIQAIGFLLSVLGFIVLGAALWRSRAVPRWLAAAVPLSQIAMIAGGAGIVYDVLHAVFMATLVAIAWLAWRGRTE
ncbi:hypothetical protein [Thermoactinospora rubra]|uniref:hypothetical protein n=1 Tax=Thermoactinospora rubra TaxID=1088767 RepID=UPI000A0FB51A|nr:hypothetical protein [Thermoactinospora rubra]